ncbi:4-hydroxyphenylpyruvate dioxygenase [Polymorphospora rubra]|uniref:4-hydroxyphenylpyruvate dioxygenase n=1 Tax=Polymorphospora rubra TaxID=338584 RepID=UPI0033D19E81
MDPAGIDHVELCTDQPDQLVAYFRDGMGCTARPVDDPAGGGRVLLTQGDIRLLITPGSADDTAARYVERHGDGVRDIAFGVADAAQAYATALRRGGQPVTAPAVRTLPDGTPGLVAAVAGPGDLVHSLVQRLEPALPAARDGALLTLVDHVAMCVPAGELASTVEFYSRVFGLRTIFEEKIEVGDQAMNSTVVQNQRADITLTLIEPDTSRAPGQIDAFVADHGGPGVQHLAFLTDDITVAVPTLRDRAVTFLTAPESYYPMLAERLPHLENVIAPLRGLNVLLDNDHWGHLLQIFTQSRHPRGTLFYEIIERRQARTFGSGNIRALYAAVEHDRLTAGAPDRK